MKKIVYFLLIALAFMACKPKDETNKITSNPNDASITGTCVSGDAPQWVVVGDLSLSQMAVIVDENGVPAKMAENDQLAAFVGEECRGAVKAFKDGENKWRFNLTVHATSKDEDLSKLQFTLRYYSTQEAGTYTSQAIQYEDDAFLGSTAKGYVPAWK